MSTKKEDILGAWSTFFVSHAFCIRQIEEQLAGVSPLSLHEYDVLLTLSRSIDQRLRLSQLAQESVFTRSGITRIVKRLEKKKYLARFQCQEDKRGTFAQLSDRGGKALHKSWELYSQAILEIFNPALSQAEARELKKLLEKVLQQVGPQPFVAIEDVTTSGNGKKI